MYQSDLELCLIVFKDLFSLITNYLKVVHGHNLLLLPFIKCTPIKAWPQRHLSLN